MPQVMPPVQWVPLVPAAKCPEKKRRFDAGWDFFSSHDVLIQPASMAAVRTGIALAIPDGWYGQLQGRSGLASKSVQPRAFMNENGDVLGGAIDSTYRGEVIVLIANLNHYTEYRVRPGDKIAQMMFHAVPDTSFVRPTNDKLPSSDRGTDGIGSSDGSGDKSTADLTGKRVPGHNDAYRVSDDKSGTAVPQYVGDLDDVPAWIVGLAWDLYKKRRDYTNLPPGRQVDFFAKSIYRALKKESAERIAELRREMMDKIGGFRTKQPVSCGPFGFRMYANGPYMTTGPTKDVERPQPPTAEDVDFGQRMANAINRILERRRFVYGSLAGDMLQNMTGDEAIKHAKEVWGKDHPIIEDLRKYFGIGQPGYQPNSTFRIVTSKKS